MEDEIPLIYGLEYQTRALCAQVNETEIKRFLIGTQTLKNINQVHLIEYDDDSNSLTKCIYDHKEGEIWHIASSPQNKLQFLTCYNQTSSPGSLQMKCSIWELEENCEMSIIADDSNHFSLKHLADIPQQVSITSIWEPSGKKIISLSENSINFYDLNDSSEPTVNFLSSIEKTAIILKFKLISAANLEAKGQPKFTNCKWNMHHNYSQIATCNDTAIRGWDLKSMKQTYVIENSHGQLVRDIDFNPNKQYYLVSVGDDCKTKFWDVRKTNECLKTLTHHSHWIWSVKYNTFHDQLILTGSSDNKVVLSSISSLSSEPYKTIIDDENSPGESKQVIDPDKVVKIYEDHEDSVYSVEWSSVEPWVFASLSYDGRLVINKVPKEEKYRILL